MISLFEQWFIPHGCCTGPGQYAIAAIAALLLTAVGKGGFGGLGTLSVPILMMVMRNESATLAVAMWAPMLIICDACTLPFYAKDCNWRPILLLAPWTTTGLLIGRLCLDWFRRNPEAGGWLKVTIGALSIAFALSQAARYYVAMRARRRVEPWHPTWWQAIPFGLTAGITTMIAHAAGSIFAMFMIPQMMDRRLFVGTSARYYLLFNTLKIPFFMLSFPLSIQNRLPDLGKPASDPLDGPAGPARRDGWQLAEQQLLQPFLQPDHQRPAGPDRRVHGLHEPAVAEVRVVVSCQWSVDSPLCVHQDPRDLRPGELRRRHLPRLEHLPHLRPRQEHVVLLAVRAGLG